MEIVRRLYSRYSLENACVHHALPGADPGFFLGGGALVPCSTSTPINHIVFFFGQNTSCIRKPLVISGGVRTPCTLPLDPPLFTFVFQPCTLQIIAVLEQSCALKLSHIFSLKGRVTVFLSVILLILTITPPHQCAIDLNVNEEFTLKPENQSLLSYKYTSKTLYQTSPTTGKNKL